jgi:TfoX/Sxy family transcriptional regulator of competence genes
VAYEHDLAERVRVALAGVPVTEKSMFGGLAFLLGGNMSVAVSGQGGGLLVRVDPERTEELLAEPGAEEFAMGGRGPMKGWLRVRPDVLDDPTLRSWVERGVSYARTLPAK